MGKNLKGKECGKGIYQRKDGKYSARYCAKNGDRPEDEAGIKRFCMHALRYTYATRAIERGVPLKVLQQLLGHASIKTTMDRYVHVTDESMSAAIRQFEAAG